jgi:hypothetical protein
MLYWFGEEIDAMTDKLKVLTEHITLHPCPNQVIITRMNPTAMSYEDEVNNLALKYIAKCHEQSSWNETTLKAALEFTP